MGGVEEKGPSFGCVTIVTGLVGMLAGPTHEVKEQLDPLHRTAGTPVHIHPRSLCLQF